MLVLLLANMESSSPAMDDKKQMPFKTNLFVLDCVTEWHDDLATGKPCGSHPWICV